jgi:hypothetical protein
VENMIEGGQEMSDDPEERLGGEFFPVMKLIRPQSSIQIIKPEDYPNCQDDNKYQPVKLMATLKNCLFAQSLRYAQNLILGISVICLWLNFSHALILNENPHFSRRPQA